MAFSCRLVCYTLFSVHSSFLQHQQARASIGWLLGLGCWVFLQRHNYFIPSLWTSPVWNRMYTAYSRGRKSTDYTIEQLKTMIWRYYMSYWNNRRICSSIGWMPPAEKRRRYYSDKTGKIGRRNGINIHSVTLRWYLFHCTVVQNRWVKCVKLHWQYQISGFA